MYCKMKSYCYFCGVKTTQERALAKFRAYE